LYFFLAAKHPGLRRQPKPARRPGRLLSVHDPPLIDLEALACHSTNVIARQRKRWRAIPFAGFLSGFPDRSPTTAPIVPGFPVPTVSAARSATPVTRFASLAWPVRSGPVARTVPPQPHRSARRPPGGMDHFPPGTASPREPGWFPHAMTTTAGCHGDPAPFLRFRLVCALREGNDPFRREAFGPNGGAGEERVRQLVRCEPATRGKRTG